MYKKAGGKKNGLLVVFFAPFFLFISFLSNASMGVCGNCRCAYNRFFAQGKGGSWHGCCWKLILSSLLLHHIQTDCMIWKTAEPITTKMNRAISSGETG